MARKKKRVIKINWSVVFSSAIILSAFIVVSIFSGNDWNKWLPNIEGFSSQIFTNYSLNKVPKTADVLVHYIDVGQGDSILIQSGVENVLIDAGENDKSEDVVAYLKSIGVKTLNMVVATHPHSDHIGGLDVVIENFDVKKVIMPEVPKDILPTNKTYTDFLYAIKDNSVKANLAYPGDSYKVGDGTLTVLGPVNAYDNLNNLSLVMKFSYKSKAFLFTGDQESDAEYDLLNTGADVSADVLKVGHHGSSTSSSQKFIDAVGADIYVIEVGRDNRYNHPHAEIRQRLGETGKPVYRTDIDGTVVMATDGKEISIYTER